MSKNTGVPRWIENPNPLLPQGFQRAVATAGGYALVGGGRDELGRSYIIVGSGFVVRKLNPKYPDSKPGTIAVRKATRLPLTEETAEALSALIAWKDVLPQETAAEQASTRSKLGDVL